MKRIGVIVVGLSIIISLGIAATMYAAVGVPYSFSTGNPVSSSQMNSNFSTLTNQMPRVASVNQTAGVGLTSSYSNVLTISVTAPTAGFVHLTATGETQLSGKTTSGYSSIYMGISSVSAGAPLAGNYTRFYLDVSQSGSFEIPYAVQAVFTVPAAGSYTYYLVGMNNGASGSGASYFGRLTAEFFPTNW